MSMPDWVWGRLVMVADRRGVKVGQLIADLLRREIDAAGLVHPARVVPVRAGVTIQDLIDRAVASQDRARVLALEVRAAREGGYRAPGHGRKGSK